jgi:hypothetical protein
MSHRNEMICQQVTLSGYAEWPQVADAVIEAKKPKVVNASVQGQKPQGFLDWFFNLFTRRQEIY